MFRNETPAPRQIGRTGAAAMLLVAGALASGCATRTPPLYQWDAYQPQVYAYLQGKTSPEEQIAALEKAGQQIGAKGNHHPPGFHAHLGTLYASVGKKDEARAEWIAEKEVFPESSAYMDFLLKNLAR